MLFMQMPFYLQKVFTSCVYVFIMWNNLQQKIV